MDMYFSLKQPKVGNLVVQSRSAAPQREGWGLFLGLQFSSSGLPHRQGFCNSSLHIYHTGRKREEAGKNQTSAYQQCQSALKAILCKIPHCDPYLYLLTPSIVLDQS